MLRKAVMITAALTLACGAVAVGAVPSGAESGTHCTFQHVPDLKPGVSYTPTSGTFVDPGGGTVDCKGAVNGSGSYTDSGTYSNATCQSGGNAEGDPSFTIGGQTFTDHIRIVFGKEPSTNGKGIVHATFEGDKVKGTIELTPTKGDCISSPVTQIKGVGEFDLK
ncbi:MAG TPA: hypothetical protein VG034_10345 [Acidimicrobiia bacterium]|jgi:hypothetical protein|nr:hypothetical protein [Acidimicrobiia bacterium]